jgi:hypothetical protein
MNQLEEQYIKDFEVKKLRAKECDEYGLGGVGNNEFKYKKYGLMRFSYYPFWKVHNGGFELFCSRSSQPEKALIECLEWVDRKIEEIEVRKTKERNLKELIEYFA